MKRFTPFSTLLKELRDLTDVKTQTISDALGYDCTYISKWISGAKLPASKSAKRNIRDLAAFFCKTSPDLLALQSALMDRGILKESESSGQPGQDWLYDVLLQRYEQQIVGKSEESNIPSCCLSKDEALNFLMKAIDRLYGQGEKEIRLVATVDIFSVFGNSFFSLFNDPQYTGVKLHITLVSCESSLIHMPELYCRRMIGTLNLPDYPYLTIYSVPSPPSCGLIVLRQELALNVILQDGIFLASFCSKDPTAVDTLYRYCTEVFSNLRPLITPASPEAIRRANIQIDGYSIYGNLLFFSDAPAFLVPPSVLSTLCLRYADDPGYVNYLERISRINSGLSPNNRSDIIIYKSIFLEYLSNGVIEIGNRHVTLTPGERRAHIGFLADCMERCPGIRIYMINDVGAGIYRHEKGLSIFIDSRVLTVERMRKRCGKAFPQYHVSSTVLLLDAFRSFLTDPMKLKECTKLTPDQMHEYEASCSDNA